MKRPRKAGILQNELRRWRYHREPSGDIRSDGIRRRLRGTPHSSRLDVEAGRQPGRMKAGMTEANTGNATLTKWQGRLLRAGK